jgi:hypothetical protein
MNRYAISGFFLVCVVSPAVAQTPISGAFPPWSPGTAPPTAYSPKEVPIITQTPVTYMITDQVIGEIKGVVPDLALLKLNPIKGKEFNLKELMYNLEKLLTLTPEETNTFTRDDRKRWIDDIPRWKETIAFYSQISSPKLIQVPSGKPLVGYYKMDALLVGADGRYPFDSGEYSLAGFQGNARIYGTFCVTLPPPADADPANATIGYKPCRDYFKKPCTDR